MQILRKFALSTMAAGALLTAGCSDLAECSCTPGCPIPFADLDRRAAHRPTTPDGEARRCSN